jgi:hypothetical protein
MTRFEVVLEAVIDGSAAGTTRDVIEAGDSAEAEAKAIAAWEQVDPRFTFRPLLTATVRETAASD